MAVARHLEQPPKVETLAPGLVVVRGAVATADQQRLSKTAARLGRRKGNGFLDREGKLNAAAGRGRIYEQVSLLPGQFQRICMSSVAAARREDSELPAMRATHCLINKYTTSDGLVWHRDIYANDGDGDKPVVNLSVGAACVFGYKRGNRVEKVRLRSGDALLFGGPSRYVQHAVLSIDLSDKPQWMCEEDAHRLSFTFRDAASVLGQEGHFRRFDVKKHLTQQRTWRPGMPLIGAQASQAA